MPGFAAHLAQASVGASARALPYALIVGVVTLAGLALRFVLLDRFLFREDEAIYAYWALHLWHEDPFFLHVWPDKPPLYLWLLAGTFRLLGASEASARWLNISLSALLIPVVASAARRLWGRHAAMASAVIVALNPYAIGFAPTAYTDPLLVLAGTLAFCLALYGRSFWAGVFLGAAIMTKQQGILYAPLAIGGVMVTAYGARQQGGIVAYGGRRLIWFGGGVASVILPIIYWDSLRWAVAPSPWDLSARHYTTLALLPPNQWWARLLAWQDLTWYLAAGWPAWMGLAALIIGAVVLVRRSPSVCTNPFPGSNAALVLIAGWSFIYLLAHAMTTVEVWDRYLLPLAPMLALGSGWAVRALWTQQTSIFTRRQRAAIAVTGALLLLPPAFQAAAGHLPIGGDHGAYTGLRGALSRIAPADGAPFILYHRALGWHYRFYLYDSGQEGQADLRWFPSATYLADNAAKSPYPPKYLIEPDWAPLPDLVQHLKMRGLALQSNGRIGRFSVWEIVAMPATACDWCSCRPLTNWTRLSIAREPSVMSLR